jgi:serine/threonine protein kinase
VEFLVHMALGAGVSSVNSLSQKGHLDRYPKHTSSTDDNSDTAERPLSQSEHVPMGYTQPPSIAIRHQRQERTSVTGAPLDLAWRQLNNVEYLTDGGNSWIHTAVLNGQPIVVKTLKPECQDVSVAMIEIEGELDIHARLNHPHIVTLVGAGTTSKGVRFVVMERLDGGTLTQMLGYDTRIRDRRRRFWRRKQVAFVDVLRIARSIAEAMAYCHEEAIPGCVVLHRDLKPDNIGKYFLPLGSRYVSPGLIRVTHSLPLSTGFTLDGSVKLIDFGLAKLIENASVDSTESYAMSGETGSKFSFHPPRTIAPSPIILTLSRPIYYAGLRYMAPEVADGLPYNWTVDVYSFGIILWEMNAGKKPFEGLNREMFYERVVHGGDRPPVKNKWPDALKSLMRDCWDDDPSSRPKFRDIIRRLDGMLSNEKAGTGDGDKKSIQKRLTGMIDRHSTWF